MASEISLKCETIGQVLIQSAARFGTQPFLTVNGTTYSFLEASEISLAVAKGLQELGVQPQDPVIVMLDNSAEFVFSWFALMLLNATCVPVNTGYSGDLLAYVIGDVKPRVVITKAELLPAFDALSPTQRGTIRNLVVCGHENLVPEQGLHTWQSVMQSVGSPALIKDDPADPAFIAYTSGTTGPSKGVILPHSLVLQTAQNFINAVGMTSEDKVFSPLPLFHGMSRTMAVLPALILGAKVQLGSRFSATTFWQDVREASATIATTIFTIPPVLKHKPPSPDDRAHQVRVMFNAHHDPEFEERFGVRLVESHAMTETGMTIFTPFPERKLGASGRPGPDWEVALVDERDRPVPVGQPGELVLRPRRPGVMMDGYLNKAEATVAAMRALWFHTGDLMRQDEDGYLFFAGRKKERIRRRGENISAYEIEMVAIQHLDVVECAVVGVPAGDNEDDVYLVGVLREQDAVTPALFFEWLSTRLPKFMVPRYIEFRESLPKTPSAKIEKHALLKTLPASTAWDSLKSNDLNN